MINNFQNKMLFPAPEHSYTTQTAFGQVIYIPRDIMQRARKLEKIGYPRRKSGNVVSHGAATKEYTASSDDLLNESHRPEKLKV